MEQTATQIANVISISQVRADRRLAAEAPTEHGVAVAAHWYVLRVKPGQERTVQAWLAGRGHGTYLPMAADGALRFAGYIFFQSRDILRDALKLKVIPGIIDVVRYAGSETIEGAKDAARVYATVSFDKINEIRTLEHLERALGELRSGPRNRRSGRQYKNRKRALRRAYNQVLKNAA